MWTAPWTVSHFVTQDNGDAIPEDTTCDDMVPRPLIEVTPGYAWQGDWIVSEPEYSMQWGGPWYSEEESVNCHYTGRRKLYIRVQVPVETHEDMMMHHETALEKHELQEVEA